MNKSQNIFPDVGGCDKEEEDTMDYVSDSESSESGSSDSDYPWREDKVVSWEPTIFNL